MEHCKTLHHERKYFLKNQDAILIKGKKETFHDGRRPKCVIIPTFSIEQKSIQNSKI